MLASSAAISVPSDAAISAERARRKSPADDGHQIAEAGVDALHVAPHQGLVHHVVVVQRRQVDELDRDGSLEVVGCGGPAPARGRGQRQAGAQALAPGRDEVRGHLVQEPVARTDGIPELGFQPLEVVLEEGE